MRDWSPTLVAMLASKEVTRCFQIELVNSITLCGTVRLTNLDQDLPVSGNTFLKSPGFNVTKFTVANGGRPAGLDISLPFDAEGPIYSDHVKRGAWRGAAAKVWLADFTNPTDREIILDGFVGKTGFTDRLAGKFELVTQGDVFADLILPTVQPKCWYHFGSAPCPVDLGPLTLSATVAAVVNNAKFTITVSNPDALKLTHGKVIFASGDNAGAKGETRRFTSGTGLVEMVRAFPFDIEVGDTLTISAGCAQDRTDCAAYGAINSYPGQDYTPGELLGDA
ncbi:DUF2163 domain-containing protein [Mesorhizobium sp. 128a]